ncbi:MAG TPA: site-specific DNA-methyltransferase [Candidatus Acidoferrum sp.]|nr:site-specific DNA-methyltransferase [Candidatus Acidoferrum sp.]
MPKKAPKAEFRSQEPEARRGKAKPLYRRKPPKPGRETRDESREPKGRAALLRRQAERQLGPTTDIPHAHLLAPAHFTLREDGAIEPQAAIASRDETSTLPGQPSSLPKLVYQSDSPFIRLYHGNCFELLDAIYAKYGDAGRFDAIFADPPYFLSNGGITCHAGRMVRVDKGDWDTLASLGSGERNQPKAEAREGRASGRERVSSAAYELMHEFNVEWLRRCQRVLKPNGTLWVSGTHHVIFSIGYALQQLGYKILNDIAWEKPNPPPNLSCRYFTHSTETILWAAKNDRSKHLFNYQEMRKVTGKQMKTVWRKEEFTAKAPSAPSSEPEDKNESETLASSASWRLNPIWTMSAPGADEKEHGKHPTQKPVALVERCLLASTHPGDLVLDPFLGGGTTAVAALRLNRQCVGIELDIAHLRLAAKRVDREIIEIWLRHFRIRIDVSVIGRAELPLRQAAQQRGPTETQIDLAIFPDSINGSRAMADVPEIQTERIFHECKFVFLSAAQVQRGAVVHTTVDVSLQEAWAKTPTGKKRETTHIVRCETEILRVKSSG